MNFHFLYYYLETYSKPDRCGLCKSLDFVLVGPHGASE